MSRLESALMGWIAGLMVGASTCNYIHVSEKQHLDKTPIVEEYQDVDKDGIKDRVFKRGDSIEQVQYGVKDGNTIEYKLEKK